MRCEHCYKEISKGDIVRWFDKNDKECVAHRVCDLAIQLYGKCPQCASSTGIKMPSGYPIYCEDCGWPDDDFGIVLEVDND